MQALVIWGLLSGSALVPAVATAAESAPVAGRAPSAARAAAPASRPVQAWGNVPNVTLAQPGAVSAPASTSAPAPAPRPAGWGPGGWQSGDAAPAVVGSATPVTAAAPPVMPAARLDRMETGNRAGPPPRGERLHGRHGDAATPAYGVGQKAWRGRYNRVGRGYVVPGYLRAPNFVVPDWWSYGLAQPGFGQSWVRYYDDALLVDGRGRVIDSRYGLAWDRDDTRDNARDYGDGPYQRGNYDRGFGAGSDGYSVYRSGPGAPGVTVHRGGGGSTVVVVQDPSTTTTTTTTYYDEVVGAPRKAWKRR